MRAFSVSKCSFAILHKCSLGIGRFTLHPKHSVGGRRRQRRRARLRRRIRESCHSSIAVPDKTYHCGTHAPIDPGLLHAHTHTHTLPAYLISRSTVKKAHDLNKAAGASILPQKICRDFLFSVTPPVTLPKCINGPRGVMEGSLKLAVRAARDCCRLIRGLWGSLKPCGPLG
jgi:hypothetical protein